MSIQWINTLFMLRLLVAELMFAWTYRQRRRFTFRLTVVTVVCFLFAWFFPMAWFDQFPLNIFSFALLFAATVGGVYFCYDCSVWNILFAGIAGYLTEHFASQVSSILEDFARGLLELSAAGEAACTLCSVLIVYGAFYVLFARKIRRGEHPNVDNKRLIVISGIALFLCIIVSTISMSAQNALPLPLKATVQAVGRTYAMLCCAVLLMLLFGILTQRQLQADLTISQHLLYQEKKQYELSKANIELINVKCHDLKHQIGALRENASEESIREIERAVLLYDSVVKTGNDALDVILTEKSLYCQEHGIRLSCMVDGEKLGFIDTSDLYALFGNLMENAIEAVSKVEDPEMRDLSLIVKQDRGFLVIWVENYYVGELRFENGLPLTTKTEEPEYHGFGMKSIRLLVEKYHGTLVIQPEEDIFRLKIVFPMVEEAA